MTLREEIAEKRKELWRDSDLTEMGEAQELIIERIDRMDDRIHELESEVVNLNLRIDSLEFHAKVNYSNPSDPPEPFTGHNELMKEAIPVHKAAIAEKKRELYDGPKMERT